MDERQQVDDIWNTHQMLLFTRCCPESRHLRQGPVIHLNHSAMPSVSEHRFIVLAVPVLLACLAHVHVLSVDGCVLTMKNKCPYSVTACARSSGSATARYSLGAGAWQVLDFGTACKWPSAVVFASVGGTCGDTNLANLAEFNIGSDNNLDFYDLSNVDAYTIGLQIVPARSGCKAPVCSIPDVKAFCQPGNRLQSFSTGAMTCHNTDGQAGIVTPSNQHFKVACPDAYSYNFDDATSTWTCATGTDYQVVFCP